MEFEHAKQLLLHHSFQHPDFYHRKSAGGFIGSLRPYQGLNEDNFHEVMAAIVALAPHLLQSRQVDRDVMGALWSLCCAARDWGLHPNGMLRRNGLIAHEDVERLEGWVEAIEWAVMMLLDCEPAAPLNEILVEALASYRQVTGREFPPDAAPI
jgi:hypothetical protein